MWNILYTPSENRCLVINEIPSLWFLFTSYITEPLCMGKAGRIFGTIENNFPWISDLTIITLPMRGYVPYLWKVGGNRAKCLKSWVLESRKMEFESQLCHLAGDI